MYFDGVINVHENEIKAILISTTGTHFLVPIRFPYTNNMAEYEAFVVSLKAALHINVKYLEVYGDYILIISQSQESGKSGFCQIQVASN